MTLENPDPFGGRAPTAHERMTGVPWDASYADGPAPWDLGRPQPAVVRLAAARRFAGPVLDAGCGTGENALHIAASGLPVLGVDVAGTALAAAREKARERGLHAEFEVADALHLERLGRRFATVLDVGLFHALAGEERPAYVAGLAAVTEPGGVLHVLCFSDQGDDTGPHPVTRAELRAAFSPGTGWDVGTIEPTRLETRFHGDDGAPAWLATVRRTTAEVDDFLADVLPRLRDAELALHRGDAGPRSALWSHDDPVTLFGAEVNRTGWSEVGPAFDWVATRFSECTSLEYEIVAAGASGDLGYLVVIERISAVANGAPASYALRATTVFRREDGVWRGVHRHGDRYQGD